MAEKTSKSKTLLLGLVLAAVCLGIVFAVVMSPLSTKGKVGQWLGIKLPDDVGDIRYWYQQPAGYYHADLACRFQLSRESFLRLMNDAGIEKVNGSEWPLPTNFNSDSSIMWWNPPSIQADRFHQQQGAGWITFVWSDGFVYAERNGNFGSMWGPHKTVHN
jgi:hypothetical protein